MDASNDVTKKIIIVFSKDANWIDDRKKANFNSLGEIYNNMFWHFKEKPIFLLFFLLPQLLFDFV